MHKYSKAPLPFLGQKRNWLKTIKTLDFTDKIVIDLFGGSGLLSHTIKQNNPTATVIWNDFDDYQSRLNQIKATESLRQVLNELTKHIEKASRPSLELQQKIIDAIQASGCIDYITISSWLLFGGKYAHSLDELLAHAWYCRVNQTPLSSLNYLNGIKREQLDFRELLSKYSYQDNVIYVADPPYIMTNQQGYVKGKNDEHFRLKDAIALIQALKGKQALIFSSTKSETDDLLGIFNSGDNIKRIEYQASLPEGRKYTELLYLMNWEK